MAWPAKWSPRWNRTPSPTPLPCWSVFLSPPGAAIGAGPHAVADGAAHPARLFAILIGDTSKARKGSSWANVRKIMHAAEPEFVTERVLGGFGSGEALVDAVKDGDPRLLVLEPEFARLLSVGRRDGATLSPIVREAWDGGRLQVRSRAGTAVADGAHVGVLGHITADELRAKLTETDVANGFVNRHLLVCVRKSKLLPSGGNLDDQGVFQVGRKVRASLVGARRVGLVRRTPDAEVRWADLYRIMDKDDPGGLLGAVIARDAAQVLRLSVTHALGSTQAPTELDVEHLEAAWALWSYCRAGAAYIFEDRLGDDVADRLLDELRRAGPGGLARDDQHKVLGRHIAAKRLDIARSLLVAKGLAVETEQPQEGGVGRTRTVLRDARQVRDISHVSHVSAISHTNRAAPPSDQGIAQWTGEGENPSAAGDRAPKVINASR